MQKIPRHHQLSAGVIVYSFIEGVPHVLLLRQSNEHYNRKGQRAKRHIMDIGPSGRMESGENLITTAAREMQQETGLDLKIDRSFDESYSYTFRAPALAGKNKGKPVDIMKTRRYFAARCSQEEIKKVRLSPEHVEYMVVPLSKVASIKGLQKGQRRLLQKFEKYLQKTSLNSLSGNK